VQLSQVVKLGRVGAERMKGLKVGEEMGEDSGQVSRGKRLRKSLHVPLNGNLYVEAPPITVLYAIAPYLKGRSPSRVARVRLPIHRELGLFAHCVARVARPPYGNGTRPQRVPL
jgi:hypothetical protein